MSKRSIVLIRRRVSEAQTYVDLYEEDGNFLVPAEMALRAAAAEFLATPEGKKAIQLSGYDWNWGDLTLDLPPKFLKRYGLKKSPQEVRYVEVDQDEVLVPETPSMGIVLKDVP